ncbi:MAG: preprotein translocase subunit [Phenylobacterium sp.]|nr:preprotein translocase subunit [Phenylobacterium sp.]
MQEDSSRNTIIFLVCALGLFIVYQMFVLEPAQKRRQAELAAARPAATAQQLQRPGAPVLNVPPAVTRAAALAASPRVPIVTPALKGSISLKGARIDDLFLTQYRETVDRNSPPVELLRPEGAPHAWFAEMGWTGANVPGLPNSDTLWTLAQGSTLSPGQPVVLTYTNGQGLTFNRRIDVDDRFMFTITDTVANNSAAPVTLAPYGSIQRQGMPVASAGSQVVHEGAVGALGEDKPTLKLIKYKKWAKDGATGPIPSKGGWVGTTDKYWLTALIPNQGEAIQGQFRVTKANGLDIFDANFVDAARAVGPGQQVTETTHFFAGAKTVPVLQAYQEKLGIPRFDSAVDWGMFWFFTRPIFTFLQYIYSHVGSFGVAILVLTVAVRLLFFPIANKQYESMTKMKKVQPQMEELRKRYKDDPAKQQQEIMALYQREKVNPVAGCLPLLLQIPVFFALYKVLSVTIEMRHAPFLWIRDLSARDPTTVWNLFGAIPWNPAHAPLIGGLLDTSLHIGILPLIYGVSMWLSTTMNPPAPDPTQQKIFQLMPLIFTFIMAPFAVGLLIYWTWTNILSILQQYVIMRRFKVDNPIDRIIGRLTGRAKAAG